ncbi:MAG: hypothetical protein OSA51_10565 [Octadecabacter sp.]|nr:hypothetical protein [Octadecabacter sp.]
MDPDASQNQLSANHGQRTEEYTCTFLKRDGITATIPQAKERMTAFSICFPLISAHCASVIVGLNSEDQVNEICDFTQNLTPGPAILAQVRALATR